MSYFPTFKNFEAKSVLAYLFGFVFFFPFINEYLPLKFLLPFAVFIGGFAFITLQNIEYKFKNIPLAVTIFLFIAVIYTVNFFSGKQYFDDSIIKYLVFFFILVFLFSIVYFYQLDFEKVVLGFFSSSIFLGALVALIGLLKFYLQERGFLLSFFIDKKLQQYPPGTSFLVDYNIFGLLLLVAIIGCFIWFLKNARNFWILVLVPIICACGLLSTSRRFICLFIFLMLTLVPLYVCLYIKKNKQMKLSFILNILAILIYMTFSIAVLTNFVSDKFQSDKFINQKSKVLIISSFKDLTYAFSLKFNTLEFSKKKEGLENININNCNVHAPNIAYSSAILNTINSKTDYGFGSRYDRWIYGLQLAKNVSLFNGYGKKYQYQFSCRFVECQFVDYPHLPMLSAILFGGWFFGLLVASIYFFIIFYIFHLRWYGLRTGVSMLGIVALPYNLISGDTIFAIPETVSIFLLVVLAYKSIEQSTFIKY